MLVTGHHTASPAVCWVAGNLTSTAFNPGPLFRPLQKLQHLALLQAQSSCTGSTSTEGSSQTSILSALQETFGARCA